MVAQPVAKANLRPAFDAAETALWNAYAETQSARDREKLFRHYQPLAKRLAARFFRRDGATPIEFDELFQLACTGLLESIDRFKPELNVPFRYFANRRIGGAILNGIAKHSELNEQITLRHRMARERLSSLKSSGKSGNLDETLDLLGEIAAGLALGLLLEESRLFTSEGKDPSRDAFDTLAWKQTVRLVRSEIEHLPSRDRDLMLWHYIDGLPFEQIAKIMGLSKGRVSQLHKAAVRSLRKRLLNAGHFRFEG